MTAPTRTALLTAQIEQEIADLRQLSILLSEVAPPTGAGRVVLDRFALLVEGVERELGAVRSAASHDCAAAWANLARVRESAAEVKREALAFVHGALLRKSELDGGTGVVGEWLLEELTQRTGIDRGVLLSVGDSEFLEHTVSMIRSRFPDVTVWNLPILAHELGHHVADTLAHARPELRTVSRPVSEYLSEEADNAQDVSRGVALAHLHELFADVYATYALGAAYPLNMVALRARPDGFHEHTTSHPSWSRRVHTVAAAARVLGRADRPGAAGYRMLADTIADLWGAATGAAGIAEADRALAENQAQAMVNLLAEHTFPRARYDFPARANRIEIDPLASQLDPPTGVTVTDVLNAAWLWRIDNWDSPSRLIDAASRRALTLCRQVNG